MMSDILSNIKKMKERILEKLMQGQNGERALNSQSQIGPYKIKWDNPFLKNGPYI